MNFNDLTKGERIVLIAGALLILDLLALPWHKIDVPSVLGVSIGDVSRTGVQSPNGGYGLLAVLVTLVMILQIVLTRFTSTTLPKPPVPWGQVHMIAGAVVLGLLLIKLVVETDFLGFGAWLGIVLAGALAFGGFTIRKEAGATPGILP